MKLPGRYLLLFLYHWLVLGAWRAGRAGWRWAWLRCLVYRLREYKLRELQRTGLPRRTPADGPGRPDPRVPQRD